ncbi:MAG: hypothetical protein F6K42_05110, partial [Leptolyngbya sp. SIO1D8]|nr:hypothetical protein [Leptolyngbya sp. SIO1D8]
MNAFLTFLVNQIVGGLFENAPEIEELGDIFIGGNGDDNLQGGDQDDIFLPKDQERLEACTAEIAEILYRNS